MKLFTLLLNTCLLLLLTQPIQANHPEYAVSEIAPALLTNANSVIRYESTDYRYHSIDKSELRYKIVVTIMNKKSSFDQAYFAYDKKFDKPGKAKAAIYNSAGKLVKKFNNKDLQDIAAVAGGTLYSNSRVKVFPIEYANYPYTIEFEYAIVHNKSIGIERWAIQNYHTSVEKAVYSISHPMNYPIHYQALNIEEKVDISETDGQKKHFWNFENLAAIESEAFSPQATSILPQLYLVPDHFRFGKYQGKMTSWKDYGLFMNELNAEADNLSKEMIESVKTMTAGAASNAEKIEILYKYLQENMRYVSVQLGVGGWQSYDAKYVEENKYGDCKALTWFMKSMLDKIDIKAYPTLVYAGDVSYQVKEDFVVPAFNHVFLRIPEEDIWLECTSRNNPVNYLGEWTANRTVLMLTDEGGQLIKTPNYVADKNKAKSTIKVNLTAEGAATVDVARELLGPQQDDIRLSKAMVNEQDIEKWFITSMENLPSFKLRDFTIYLDDKAPLTKLNYKLEIPKYASKAGKRFFLPINCINVFDEVPKEMDDRQYPVVSNESYIEEDAFVIQLPADYVVESLPESEKTIDSDYGTYRIKITSEPGNQLHYQRRLEIKPVNLPASEYGAFRQFYKQVAKLDKMKVVLVKKGT